MRENTIQLSTNEIVVECKPGKGASVMHIVDRRTGIDVLFQTPWREMAKASPPLGLGSKVTWLQQYEGGWQVLCPNAGEERVKNGGLLGYHGEAALLPWSVEMLRDERARLVVELFTAPLRIERELQLDGSQLRMIEHVYNLSSEAIEFAWVHHPVFGQPLIDEGSRIYTGARIVISDETEPGSVLLPNTVSGWPAVEGIRGNLVDLSRLSGKAVPRSVFACLADFEVPFFAIQNEKIGLGVGVRWSDDVLPYAWFWQELNATPGFPWYRRAVACAIEPANHIPGQGPVGPYTRGMWTKLEGYGARECSLDMVLFRKPGVVVGVNADGTVAIER